MLTDASEPIEPTGQGDRPDRVVPITPGWARTRALGMDPEVAAGIGQGAARLVHDDAPGVEAGDAGLLGAEGEAAAQGLLGSPRRGDEDAVAVRGNVHLQAE